MKTNTIKKSLILLFIMTSLVIMGCERQEFSRPTNGNLNNLNELPERCGDDTCQTLEEKMNSCPKDCKEEQPIQPEPSLVNIPGEYRFNLEQGILTRTFFVYIPEKNYKNNARPVIFNLHGGFGNGEQQCDMSNMMKVADKYGFIVVCPDGTNDPNGGPLSKNILYWNDGQIGTPAELNNVDDVGFIEAIIEYLDSEFNINKKKIYSTGISNGAILSFKLACEIPDKITAIAPVAGSMCNLTKECNPSRSVPVMMFNGKEDTNIPYEGGLGSGFAKYTFPPVLDSVNFWVRINKLSVEPSDTGKIGNATYTIYGKKNEAQIILWTLEDGAHTWPSGNPVLGERLLGNVNEDIDASEEMWKFFEKYTLE